MGWGRVCSLVDEASSLKCDRLLDLCSSIFKVLVSISFVLWLTSCLADGTCTRYTNIPRIIHVAMYVNRVCTSKHTLSWSCTHLVLQKPRALAKRRWTNGLKDLYIEMWLRILKIFLPVLITKFTWTFYTGAVLRILFPHEFVPSYGARRRPCKLSFSWFVSWRKAD